MTEPSLERTRYEPPTLRELVQRLLRHWVLMGGVGAAVLGIVLLGTLLMAPRYESTAVLRLVEQQSPQAQLFGEQLGSMPGVDLLGLGEEEIDTEVGVLRSWRIAEAVVDSLALVVRLEKPAAFRSDVIDVLVVGDPEVEATFRLRQQDPGIYEASLKRPDQGRRALGVVRAGDVLELEGYRIVFRPVADEDGELPGSVEIEVVPRYMAIDDLRDDLRIRKHEGGARLVDVSYRSTDRELAAAIVNTAVSEYVAYKNRAENVDAGYTAQELRKQVAEYAMRLAQAEERLRRYQEAERIIAPEEVAIQQVRRVAELQLRHDALRVERRALADLLTLIGQRVSEIEPTGDPSVVYRQLATFPTLISNGAIQDLLVGLLDLENERAELLIRRTTENTDVRQITQRIEEIERQLYRIGTNYLESLDGHLGSATAALEELNTELEAFPEKEMEYIRLARDREVLGEAYVMLQVQLRFAEVQEAIRSEGVRIVDEGLVVHEEDVAFPKLPVNLFLGAVLGLAAGVVAAVGRDAWEA